MIRNNRQEKGNEVKMKTVILGRLEKVLVKEKVFQWFCVS